MRRGEIDLPWVVRLLEKMLTNVCPFVFDMSRRLLFPAQVAQGTLRCALIRPPQDYVLRSLEGASRQAQCAPRLPYTLRTLNLIRSLFHDHRLVHYQSVRTMRSGLSEGSTGVGKARSPRYTARSGLSTSTVSSVTSRTARQYPLVSTQAKSLSPPSSWTRTGTLWFNEHFVASLIKCLFRRRAILDRKNRKKATGDDVELVDVSCGQIVFDVALTKYSKPSPPTFPVFSRWLSYYTSKQPMYVCAYLAHVMLHEAARQHVSCPLLWLTEVSFVACILPGTKASRSVHVSMYHCLQCTEWYIDDAKSGYIHIRVKRKVRLEYDVFVFAAQ